MLGLMAEGRGVGTRKIRWYILYHIRKRRTSIWEEKRGVGNTKPGKNAPENGRPQNLKNINTFVQGFFEREKKSRPCGTREKGNKKTRRKEMVFGRHSSLE